MADERVRALIAEAEELKRTNKLLVDRSGNLGKRYDVKDLVCTTFIAFINSRY